MRHGFENCSLKFALSVPAKPSIMGFLLIESDCGFFRDGTSRR